MANKISNKTSRIMGILLAASVQTAAYAEPTIPENVLVVFKSAKNLSEASRKIKQHAGLSISPKVSKIFGDTIFLAKVKKGREREVTRKLNGAANRGIEIASAEVDKNLAPSLTPNDPSFINQWHLTKIQAPTAWDTTVGAPSVIVAILDTGTDGTHPDLSSRIVGGWNMYDNNSNYADVHGHGTSTAGSAVASINNSLGVAGVAGGVGLLPIRISGTTGSASTSTAVSALDYAQKQGARVANISYMFGESSTIAAASKAFQSAGGLVAISAGNYTTRSTSSMPTSHVIVSATASNDVITSFSNYGTNVALSAPGQSILTTKLGGGYGSSSGTSFSSPIVAGVAALVISANPNLTGIQVRDILIQSADDLGTSGFDEQYGYGRVNAAKAVALARGTSVDTIAPQVSISAPADGSTIAGSTTISANASDNVAVSSIDILVDGVLKLSSSTATSSLVVDTTQLTNGAHKFAAIAKDRANNTSSALISVTVANPISETPTDTIAPSAVITSVVDNQVITRNFSVAGSYSDNIGLTKVSLFIDGKLYSSSTAAPYSINVTGKKLSSGSHTIQTKAFDAAGNIGASQIISIRK